MPANLAACRPPGQAARARPRAGGGAGVSRVGGPVEGSLPAGQADSAPTVLMAHYDVVPATDEGWTHPPFAGEITGSGEQRLLWGRGGPGIGMHQEVAPNPDALKMALKGINVSQPGII